MEEKANENYSCHICGGSEFISSVEKNNFKYVLCSYCGVTRQFPYPTKEELKAFYSQYHIHKQKENPFYLSDASWESVKNEKDLTFKDLKFSFDSFKGKKILDVGCATGLFVRYVNSKGADGYGIDIQPDLIRIALERNLKCNLKDLFDISEKFDIINMSHIIEHLDYPVKYITHVHSILNENGFLIIETPCTGLISDTFLSDWRFYMPIEHIHLFSQDSLLNMLMRNGFSIQRLVRYGSGNTSGTINPVSKRVADTIAKKLGIGDTISILCQKV